MKTMIVVALALVAVAAAAPIDHTPQIISYKFIPEPNGEYVLSFETEDGISNQAQGQLKEVLDENNKPQTVVVVSGSYSYPGSDGKPVVVTYEADENGFRAQGDSIPKPARR